MKAQSSVERQHADSSAPGPRGHAGRFGWHDLIRQAARMTARDWRAGELTLLVLALVLAVAALTSVGFLADRLRQGLERDARQMLGADFVVRADHPVDTVFTRKAQSLGLDTAGTTIFPSMISSTSAQPASRLAAIKGVTPGYPLRGALRIAPAPDAADAPAHGIPAPDHVRRDIKGVGVGSTILNAAADYSADLIVMGAYGHSKFREWAMGGATASILKSMTVPIMFSH